MQNLPIRTLAVLALLACIASAHAAQKPAKHKPVAPAQAAATAPQDIDVDAMARAKDAGAQPQSSSEPAADAAPSAAVDSKATDEGAAQAKDAAPVENAAPAADAAAAATPTDDAKAVGEAAPVPAAPAEPAVAAKSANAAEPPSPAAPSATEKSIAAGCESRATSLLDAAQKGDYATATRDFDAKMRTALPPPKFKQAWESLAQFGTLKARGQSHPIKGEGYIAITIPLIFDKANLYAQIACGSDGRVAGFYVKPL